LREKLEPIALILGTGAYTRSALPWLPVRDERGGVWRIGLVLRSPRGGGDDEKLEATDDADDAEIGPRPAITRRVSRRPASAPVGPGRVRVPASRRTWRVLPRSPRAAPDPSTPGSTLCHCQQYTGTGGGENYRQDFADYGFDGLVDAFVTSIDLRVRKPDPRIFDFALRTIGCTATNVVMVGNSEFNDIEPAARLGARTIRVAIEEPVPAQSLATVVVGSLFDVAQQIEHWALPGGWHSSSPSIR
jgi:hypothetical protein